MMDKRLDRLIQAHELYWQGKDSPMTDSEYDSEIIWLSKSYPNHFLLKKIGGNKLSQSRIIHDSPMLSLDKAYTKKEIEKFIRNTSRNEREKYIAQAKFDGLAGKFQNNILSTRGDGHVGEDISHKIKDMILIRNKEQIPLCGVSENIIGEIICSKDQFKKYGKGYKSPRNFIIGMIGQKGKMPEGFRPHFVEYKSSPSICYEASEFLDQWDNIINFFESFDSYAKDGIVIKLKDEAYSLSLGSTSHHPKGAIAYKFHGEVSETTLRKVVWQAGKNCLTPVAEFMPVILGGVTVSRATLHNYANVEELDLHIGDVLQIERAGDVIPYVIGSTPGERRGDEVDIKNCPYCGSEVVRRSVEISCENLDCPGTCFSRLTASIKESEIEWLGPGILSKIVAHKKCRCLSDIFDLSVNDIFESGVGENMSKKIRKSIRDHSLMSAPQFLSCLNIEGMGRTNWKTILNFVSFEELVDGVSKERLRRIPGIGPILMRKIIQGISSKRNEIKELLKRVHIEDEGMKETPSRKKICFTGKMPEKRSFYEDLAKQNGFESVSSVTKELDVLVCDDILSTSSKCLAAKKSGIKILSLNEWMKGLKNGDN